MKKTIDHKEYRWGMGFPFSSKGDSQVIGELIENENLKTRERIWEMAQEDKDSPLRPFFEWNKNKAFDKYNLERAGDIIKGLEVNIVYTGGETTLLPRAFEMVYQGDEDRRSFIATEEGLLDKDMRRQILRHALDSIKDWTSKYRQYKEFSRIVKAVIETDIALKEENILE